MYTWEAAKSACPLFGPGWRLPARADWDNLAAAVGGKSVAGKKGHGGVVAPQCPFLFRIRILRLSGTPVNIIFTSNRYKYTFFLREYAPPCVKAHEFG
ncbi:MAG: hypothetical protein LBB74_01815 [Chitinispirillales bacterium]|nr:hypothetical protein [Chitinispirillales bacterium]